MLICPACTGTGFETTDPEDASACDVCNGRCEFPDALSIVRFVADDRYGAWKRGDYAENLGAESHDLPMILLRMIRTHELLSITSPFERGLVEAI